MIIVMTRSPIIIRTLIHEDFRWHDITWNSSMVKNLRDILHRLRQTVLALESITIVAWFIIHYLFLVFLIIWIS